MRQSQYATFDVVESGDDVGVYFLRLVVWMLMKRL
jgi:hypothetical protein